MTSYRTVIAFRCPEVLTDTPSNPIQYYETIKYLPIDFLEDRSIRASSTIVSQPLQNGDTMSDHMYRNPTELELSGKFSLNGRNWQNDSYTDIYNTDDRLTAIEWVFEWIKNNGSLCTITTVATDIDNVDQFSYDSNGNVSGNINPSNTRFITRENMALTNISWKEKQNTLEFTFSFKEVIMIDTEVYDIDPKDLNLPASLEQPSAQSLGNILFDSGDLPKMITETLYKNGYINNDWLMGVQNAVADYGTYFIVLQIVGVAVGVIVASVAITSAVGVGAMLTSSVAAIFPVGTVIAAAVAVVAAIGWGIATIINRHKEREKQKRAFKLVNGDPIPDYNRYCNFMDDVQSAVNVAGSNITVYSFTSDDEQQFCLPIGGNYYYITVTKVNDDPWFKADIKINGFGEQGDSIKNLRCDYWCPVCNFTDLNENINMWFKDESKQYQVYLVNPNLNDVINNEEDEKVAVKKLLTSYSIWICKGSIKAEIEKITNAINDTIIAHEFD